MVRGRCFGDAVSQLWTCARQRRWRGKLQWLRLGDTSGETALAAALAARRLAGDHLAHTAHRSQIQEFSAAENIELKSVLLNPAAPPEASTGLHRQQG